MEYKYDALAHRLEKSVDLDGDGPAGPAIVRYVVDGWNPAKGSPRGTENADVLFELDADGSLTTRYVRGDVIDELFARVDYGTTTANAYWYLTDHQGSIRDIVDASGTVVNTITYDGYGRILAETNPALRGNYAYTAREYDAEIHLQYNRARYYDPATGRWISQDPLGFDAGDSNLYRYVHNRPTGATDPSGLQTTDRPLVGPPYPPPVNFRDSDSKSLFRKGPSEYQLGRTPDWYEDVIGDQSVTAGFLRLLSFIPIGKATGFSQAMNGLAGFLERSAEQLTEEYQKDFGFYDTSPEAEKQRILDKAFRYSQELQLFRPVRPQVKMQGPGPAMPRQVVEKVAPTGPFPNIPNGPNLQGIPGNGIPRPPAIPNVQGQPNVFHAAGARHDTPYLLRQLNPANRLDQPAIGNPVQLPGGVANTTQLLPRPATGGGVGQGTARTNSQNAEILTQNLAREGRAVGPGQAAAHVVASSGSRGHFAAAARSRALLARFSIDVNDAANGMRLRHHFPHNFTHREWYHEGVYNSLVSVVERMRAEGFGHNAIRYALRRELRLGSVSKLPFAQLDEFVIFMAT